MLEGSREKPSSVVIYGRRRLGKSTLVKRVLSDTDVYFLADRSESRHQRTLLAKVITQALPDFDKPAYSDWKSVFRAVNYLTDKRFTLCLDEFPYLAERSPELPHIQEALNLDARNAVDEYAVWTAVCRRHRR